MSIFNLRASTKYPRTYHLPFSPGATRDDKILEHLTYLLGPQVIVTEKLDGSNLCLTRERVYARSHSSPPAHASFDEAKALHARVRTCIPEHISIFGEYCYVVHSIKYKQLPDVFFVFAVRDDRNQEFYSYDGVKNFCKQLGFTCVPEIGRFYSSDKDEFRRQIEQFAKAPSQFGPTKEGVVVFRNHNFHMEDFRTRVAKWVRSNHVQTNEHWKHKIIEKQPIKRK